MVEHWNAPGGWPFCPYRDDLEWKQQARNECERGREPYLTKHVNAAIPGSVQLSMKTAVDT
jgi:hypothetical protein